ncbi:hypothetical protein AQUCO_01100581v1 [Aquilegia coerulea]|uniref:Glycosyltransferase n=1 Tax=Aquilegia coerulea TaxID=218851 RepID=A0A2G5E7S1_AQUCA|nr:hypothetical protein AQUCO_01100581v1 [Aquilegia coerulea]
MAEMDQKSVPHVLLFPFPLLGHVNPLLQLAELLCLSGLSNVTFLTTKHHHRRLLSFTDAQTRFSSFPGFRFETISDGLPDDHPRSYDHIIDIFTGVRSVMEPSFQKLLFSNYFQSANRPPVTCIISDGLMSFPIGVAKELGITSMDFRVTGASFLWCCFRHLNMVEAGELPFKDADMDKLITSIPGMESFLRCRDLPSFLRGCRGKVLDDSLKIVNSSHDLRPNATIINTFEDLEAPILAEMRPHFPKIFTLGPLHALLSTLHSGRSISSNNSLYEVDQGCITWLDSQQPNSVVYVSFGSIVMMTHTQMLEFWYGLVNSGKRFLWVIRPDFVIDKDENFQVPGDLTSETKERGYIVEWSPQEEVLAHPAVGGFLTHSGWSSTLESIMAGVPMLCWPQIGDHYINSRFVSEVWKVGLDMKDTCDRLTIEKMVNDLMDTKRDELMRSMDEISQLARKSVSKGGSSYGNLEALVKSISNAILS